MPTLQEIVQRAIDAAGSQNKAARVMDVASGSVGEWRVGASLPTPDKEARLAALANVPPEVVKEAVYQARLRRATRPPTGGASAAATPVSKPPRAPVTAIGRSAQPGRRTNLLTTRNHKSNRLPLIGHSSYHGWWRHPCTDHDMAA